MTDALLDLPPYRRRRLAASLDTGFLDAPFTSESVGAVLGSSEPSEALLRALDRMERLGLSGRAKAAWIRSLEAAETRRRMPEFVWSGPQVPELHARETRQAIRQSLAVAKRSVWLSSYVFFDGPQVFAPLAGRMKQVPELQVTLVLNIERKRNDTTAPEDLVFRFAHRFWEEEWPGETRPRVFYDPRSLALDGAAGVLHAKALVVDEERVLVTSANLTERALVSNIEIGVLLRDPVFARTVVGHFRALIRRGRLRSLPSS